MPHSEPVTILIVNEQADEIKRVTLSLRGFFPDCRIDPVYSADEALQWAGRADWHLVLIDDRLGLQGHPPLLSELKGRLPAAALVLQTERTDASAAVDALQAGADFLLHKQSPAFLTELVLYTKDAVEKRALRAALEHIRIRHDRLMATLSDVVYELDAEGRFVYLSPSVTDLLGHRPEELTGTLCTQLIPPDQLDRAQHRINDRRSGARAARRVLLELLPKPQPGMAPGTRVLTEISATGLYDAQRRFIGSLGLLRNVSGQAVQAKKIQSLEAALRDTGQLLDMAHQLTGLSHNLQTPLTAVLTQSQQLLQTIRDAQLDTRLETLALRATEAAQRGEEIALTVRQAVRRRDTVNAVLDDALATFPSPLLNTGLIERQYSPHLPVYSGPRETCMRIMHLLLAQALRRMAAGGSIHVLQLCTFPLDRTGARIEPVLSSYADSAAAAVEILLQETPRPATFDIGALTIPSDLALVYALLQPLKARLDFLAPAEGALSVRLRLPLSDGTTAPSNPPPPQPPEPSEPQQPPSAPVLTTESQQQNPVPGGPAIPDRRAAVRTEVHLPAEVTVGNTTREGTMTTLSATGATVAVGGLVPRLDHLPAYVIFKTDVGILELQATVHTRDRASAQTAGQPDRSLLVFHFTPSGATEQKVLASFVEAAHERAITFTLEALLVPPDDAESLPPSSAESAPRDTDHRETLRVRVALPIQIEAEPEGASKARGFASAVNFSRGGACLQMKHIPGQIGQTILLHFPQTGLLGQPRTHEPAAPEAVLPARIVWTTAPPVTTLKPLGDPTEAGQRVGVCFVRLTPFSEREINRVVAQHLTSPLDLDGVTDASPVVSTRRECRNIRGQLIAITDDHARRQLSPTAPIVVLAPGYGCTQTDYIGLAEFLALNRLRVLRYDHSNHVGLSDGDVHAITLGSMQADLQTVLEFAHTTWPTAPIAVLAEDLAARVALKAAAQVPLATVLLLANPVFDVQAALLAEHHRDLVADYRQGLRKGTANVWGLNVNVDQLLGDLIAGQYDTLSTTVSDLAALATPPTILTTPIGDQTPAHRFPSLAPALRAFGTPPPVVPLPAPLSGLSLALDDRRLAAYTTILRQIAAALFPREPRIEILAPAKQHIDRQRQLEEERLRIHAHISHATREALWVAHVAQLPQLTPLHPYAWLLQELYQQCLPLLPGTKILEVGCGSGDLARTICLNHLYRRAHAPGASQTPLRYIGIERLAETVSSATRSFEGFRHELQNTFAPLPGAAAGMSAHWLLADWQRSLPFTAQSVDRAIYHASLSFVSSPQAALQHALTALRPDGLLILTCFRPHTDLTWLYREHLATTGQTEDSPAGQILLHHLGRLHEAILRGQLHAFECHQLADTLRYAGAHPLRIVPILQGQLLLATARKGRSSG